MKKLLVLTAICGGTILAYQLSAMALLVGYRIEFSGSSSEKVKGYYTFVDSRGKTQTREFEETLPHSVSFNADYNGVVSAYVFTDAKVKIYKNGSKCSESQGSASCYPGN